MKLEGAGKLARALGLCEGGSRASRAGPVKVGNFRSKAATFPTTPCKQRTSAHASRRPCWDSALSIQSYELLAPDIKCLRQSPRLLRVIVIRAATGSATQQESIDRFIHEHKWLVRACCVATFTAAGLNECALACWQPNDPTLEVTCLIEYRSNGSGAVLRGCARPREQSLCLAQGFNDCTSRYEKITPTHVQPITSVQRSCGPRSSDLLTAVLAFTDTPSLLALLCAGGVLCSQPVAATQRRGIRRSAGECSM
jgi:hypothetical protein